MPILTLEKVFYKNQDKTILHDLSLKINKGDFISIVGPSGSGKSTLLRICSDLISPTSGQLYFKGKSFLDYDPIVLRQNIAYCFQTPHLFGESVQDNMAFPYTIRHLDMDITRVKYLFQQFHMSIDYLRQDISTLSGGEKQRLALIRTLLYPPEILLLDEVTSSLDSDNTFIVEQVIQSLNQAGMTILWITHNEEQSKKYARKILSLESGIISSFEEVQHG